MSDCTLSKYVSRYALRRDLKPATVKQYRYTAENFERWAGPVDCAELSSDLVNGWLAALKQLGRASWSIAGNRTRLCTLWRYANKDGFAKSPPADVRSVRRERLIPEAWDAVQMARILAVCAKQTRPLGHVPPPVFWRAFVLLAYYLGLRLQDLLDLRWSDVSPGGVVFVLQNKTGEPVGAQLPVDAVKALDALRSVRQREPLVFGGITVKRRIQERLAFIRESAGLPSGGAQQLRRTGATACEIAQPGSAMAFLGHKTPGLAYRHYVDFRKILQTRPVPPKIG